jgi:hypothetical protein
MDAGIAGTMQRIAPHLVGTQEQDVRLAHNNVRSVRQKIMGM